MRWVWTDEKNRTDKRDHGLSFETAHLVFNDPLAVSRPASYQDGDRWQTPGQIGTVGLFVVHTRPEIDETAGDEVGRIISARKATSHVRKAYEEGHFQPFDASAVRRAFRLGIAAGRSDQHA